MKTETILKLGWKVFKWDPHWPLKNLFIRMDGSSSASFSSSTIKGNFLWVANWQRPSDIVINVMIETDSTLFFHNFRYFLFGMNYHLSFLLMFVVFSRWKPTKGTRLLICAQAARYQRFIWMISLTPMRISKNFTEKNSTRFVDSLWSENRPSRIHRYFWHQMFFKLVSQKVDVSEFFAYVAEFYSLGM